MTVALEYPKRKRVGLKKASFGTEAVAIVQSRMGSRRLPGKMLMDLGGKPLLWHILQRAGAIGRACPVVLAIPDTKQDDALAQVAENLEVPVVRGPGEDVLGRFLLALKKYPAPWVVRICGDSPLLGVKHLARCLELARTAEADVVKFRTDAGTLLQGGEVVSRRALEFSRKMAPADPLSAEHVTAWVLRHAEEYPQDLKTVHVDPDPDLVLDFKLSIDTEADLARLRRLYAALWDGREIIDLHRVAAWLRGSAGNDWPKGSS